MLHINNIVSLFSATSNGVTCGDIMQWHCRGGSMRKNPHWESQWGLAQDLGFWWAYWRGFWFLMRFLMRFLILNEVLAQDLIEILILEQSHWDSQWEKQTFSVRVWASPSILGLYCAFAPGSALTPSSPPQKKNTPLLLSFDLKYQPEWDTFDAIQQHLYFQYYT